MRNDSDIWPKITDPGVFIVAEIGKNFIQTKEEKNEDEYLRNACQLIDAAVAAGVDAVKFQIHWLADEQLLVKVTAPHFQEQDRYHWVARNSRLTAGHFWPRVKSYCAKVGITFFATPMSRGAAYRLADLGVPVWKVGSGDILDFVMLDFLRNRPEPIILSSGMSTLHELDQAISFLRQKQSKIALLHCLSKYPCPANELHLELLSTFQRRYQLPVGFSDHSIGITESVLAANLGATIIEKHFSLSRGLWGSDHQVSLEPKELTALVKRIREATQPNNQSTPTLAKDMLHELPDAKSNFRPIFRKSLVAAKPLLAGTILSADMLYAMRPQSLIDGLPSQEYPNILGQTILKNIRQYEPITQESIAQNTKSIRQPARSRINV